VLADSPRYFLLVGFLVVVEDCLLMLAGWLWAGLAVQHSEPGLLAGVVGLGAPFHWSMALFLDAPPPVGDRLGMTIPGHQPNLRGASDFFVAI
jgi:hypothetical protein